MEFFIRILRGLDGFFEWLWGGVLMGGGQQGFRNGQSGKSGGDGISGQNRCLRK